MLFLPAEAGGEDGGAEMQAATDLVQAQAGAVQHAQDPRRVQAVLLQASSLPQQSQSHKYRHIQTITSLYLS